MPGDRGFNSENGFWNQYSIFLPIPVCWQSCVYTVLYGTSSLKNNPSGGTDACSNKLLGLCCVDSVGAEGHKSLVGSSGLCVKLGVVFVPLGLLCVKCGFLLILCCVCVYVCVVYGLCVFVFVFSH